MGAILVLRDIKQSSIEMKGENMFQNKEGKKQNNP